jgi:hypothetical protein
MNTPTLILLGGLIFILILQVLIGDIKKRAYRKGYKKAELDITHSMFDKANWFGGTSIITYNVLYLFAAKYRKWGHVSADRFREDILKLDHKKRVTELSKQELESLI